MTITAERETTSKKKANPLARFTTGQVTSADGTTIGYHQIGHGPGLMVLHGGARAGHHYAKLAEALSDSFTVYLPDRRGRGLSGPAGENYNLQKEMDDVQALLESTAAHFLLGHSAGGFFALESALRFPVEKLALYEPAVSINGSLPTDWVPACQEALDKEEWAKAMIIFFRGLQFGGLMSKLPDMVLTPMINLAARDDDGKELISLLGTLTREVKTFQEPNFDYHRYSQITAKTLLFGGGKSQAYLHYALRAIAKIIPNSWLIELANLDHNAPDMNAPEVVAKELKQFFL